MALEPYVVGHNSEICKVLNNRKFLELGLPVEVFEMCVITVKLVGKLLMVFYGFQFLCFVIDVIMSVLEKTSLHKFLYSRVSGRIGKV